MNWFWNRADVPIDHLPLIFPIGMNQMDFVRIDVTTIFSRILTDVVERCHGLSDDETSVLWDNCIKSEQSDGLITRLARAMCDRRDLFLVYDKALKLIRLADANEQATIEADYKKNNESTTGIYISFRHFYRADLIKIYSALEYVSVSSLHKAINLSKAVQIKMNDMRKSVNLTDADEVKAQGMALAKALADGRDVMLDAKDIIETQIPDLTGIQTAIEFINEKRSFYLGMPECYISGEQTGGLNADGTGDAKAIERGLKNYYQAVMRPVFEALFKTKTTYKSQDFTQITAASDMLKTFTLTDNELVSKENKTLILNRLFDLPEDSKGDPPPKVDPNAPLLPEPGKPGAPNIPPAKPGVPPKGNA